MNRRLDDSRPPWAAFFVRHRAALATYALALTGNEADAEDLIQDVLVRMIRQRREPEHARAYVMRCMRNRSIDMRRSRANLRHPTPEGGAAFLDAVSDDLLERERVERIRSALSSLSDEQREVIVLKTYCDMTFGEIAEILDQPPGTTASHYRRGIVAAARHLSSGGGSCHLKKPNDCSSRPRRGGSRLRPSSGF